MTKLYKTYAARRRARRSSATTQRLAPGAGAHLAKLPERLRTSEPTAALMVDAADELERLAALAAQLADALDAMACQNCDDRKCMDCVFRTHHDTCYDDCSDCCPQQRIHSPYTDRYIQRATALAAWNHANGA